MVIEPTSVPSASVAGDDVPAVRLRAALAAFGRGDGGSADVLAALASARLLVPVDPRARQLGEPGGRSTGRASAGVRIGPDGRRGLLAFTDVDAARRWDSDAVTQEVPTREVAEATVAEGADVLLIDVGGPVPFVADVQELRTLIAGWRPLGRWSIAGHPGRADGPEAEAARRWRDSEPMARAGRRWAAVARFLARPRRAR